MRVLALTHAHLKQAGLSSVSCERADSFANVWSDALGWEIDVVYTRNTEWKGIWPHGRGLKADIIEVDGSEYIFSSPEKFPVVLKRVAAERDIKAVAQLVNKRIAKKVRLSLSSKGWAYPYEIKTAEKWGMHLAGLPTIRNKSYDFVFVCAGNGDEYLLQTSLTVSKNLNIPLVIDLRDLWSDHHDPHRFTDEDRKQIRKHELRIFKDASLISVPQPPMAVRLREYVRVPVMLVSHSAHIEKHWQDGHVVSGEFRLLYSGKLYPGNPGLTMILELLKKLAAQKPDKPISCRFFVDDTERLRGLVSEMGLEKQVSIHGWVSPEEIWTEMRSAHLLLSFDAGVRDGMPLLMTKVYQYAYSGRPVLALCPFSNPVYEDFFKTYNAGAVYYNVDQAVNWVTGLVKQEQQYAVMPGLRKVLERNNVAVEFAEHIENVILHKQGNKDR